MIKKLQTLFIIVTVCLFGLSSCTEEAIDVDTVNKQTLFIYMPWTGNASGSDTGLLYYFEINLDSIESAIIQNKGLSNSRVMVFLSEEPNKSSLYEITYNETTKSIEHIVVGNYTDSSYSTPEGITNLLNEVTNRAYALNYAMIIGCHGSGWTYKEDWTDYPSRSLSQGNEQWLINYMASPNKELWTRFFGSVAKDGTAYQLNIEELAEGIQNSNIVSEGRKLQYILFDDCYMSNVETAYALRNVTNHVVASASEVMAIGMPYSEMWSYLNSATPNYTSMVSTFNTVYSNYQYPYGNLAAIDCRQMDSLAIVMKEINQQYSFPEERRDSVQVLDGFQPNLFFDLGSYISNMGVEGQLRDKFEDQLGKTVIAAQSTEEVYTALPPSIDGSPGKTIPIKEFSGLSISDISLHPVANKGLEKTEWWQATH